MITGMQWKRVPRPLFMLVAALVCSLPTTAAQDPLQTFQLTFAGAGNSLNTFP